MKRPTRAAAPNHPLHRPHRRKHLSVAGSRTLLLLIILLVGIGGYALGLNLARQEIAYNKLLVQQLQTAGQKLQKEAAELEGSNAALKAKLADMDSAMNAMKPAQNTYHLKPNQSIVVADGHLTLGLIGSPSNDNININVNGKHQLAAPGDVIRVAPNDSTNCQVAVQSFDLFAAVVNASCAAKP